MFLGIAKVLFVLTTRTLIWNPSPPVDNVDRYQVYMKNPVGWYRIAFVSEPRLLLPNTPWTRVYAVTAINSSLPINVMESQKSNPITVNPVPFAK